MSASRKGAACVAVVASLVAVAAELGRHPADGVPALLATRTAAAAPVAGQEEFRWSGQVARGAAVEIVGLSGAIAAGPAGGATAEVSAVKTGRHDPPQDVRIEVVEHGGGVTVCALYAVPEGERPNECRPGGAAGTRTRESDVRVDFEVRVPPGVRFVGRNVNGAIRAQGLDADVEAHTVNGAVTLATRGTADAETVNGAIVAAVGDAEGSGGLELRTVNGGIRLVLPREADADVAATTVNGRIRSDFPITVQGRFGPKRLSGTIGRGGRAVDLETVNGDIEIRAAS